MDASALNEVTQAVGSSDPAVGLRAIHAMRRTMDALESMHVANARDKGWSWQAIADALGVTRQAVHQKHSRRG
ncbi:helix-turn-helix domain-containing protein [Mycolicibacterium sp. S2-37]|uniref:helix-turn-helix domain-containing protein n=1 Tax=Mycolicibacterium sp. S2-37 TaxID=2810297 RepID=UPI001F5E848E|nr:helix-turn-helix domain-containing protein [Mycolicibacterium sp. S2-37]